MTRSSRRSITGLLAASLLLGSAGAAAAAPPKSFDAAFCFSYGIGLRATVTWSGYRVDAVYGGQLDGQHREFVVPVEPAARQGTVTIDLGYDDAVPFVTAGIRLVKHVWQSETVHATGLDFPNLPGC
jgi:hypothetical protein